VKHHEPLIAMRRQGLKPSVVSLRAGLPEPDAQWWPEWHPTRAEVYIAPNDTPQLLDLRFLVGCQVQISGFDPGNEERLNAQLRAIFDAACKAKAARVSVLHDIDEEILLWPM
jgi:hypothetical protein